MILANGQCKNKWFEVSKWLWHRTQRVASAGIMFIQASLDFVFSFPRKASHVKSSTFGGIIPFHIFFQLVIWESTSGEDLASSILSDLTEKSPSLEKVQEKESSASVDKHTWFRMDSIFRHSSTSLGRRVRPQVSFQIHDPSSQTPHEEIVAWGLWAIEKSRGKQMLKGPSPAQWSSQNRAVWPFPGPPYDAGLK